MTLTFAPNFLSYRKQFHRIATEAETCCNICCEFFSVLQVVLVLVLVIRVCCKTGSRQVHFDDCAFDPPQVLQVDLKLMGRICQGQPYIRLRISTGSWVLIQVAHKNLPLSAGAVFLVLQLGHKMWLRTCSGHRTYWKVCQNGFNHLVPLLVWVT